MWTIFIVLLVGTVYGWKKSLEIMKEEDDTFNVVCFEDENATAIITFILSLISIIWFVVLGICYLP